MIRALAIAAALLAASSGADRAAASASPGQQVVDRVVARIEGDIITLSQVQELAAYQQLVDGRAEPYDRLLSELIEQWIVNNEAAMARFSPASASEVDREVARIEGQFQSPELYRQKLMELGITPQAVRRIVAEEIYLARYLDYKFRPAVQVGDDAIEKYYDEQLVPALKAKNEAIPPIDAVHDQIREVLVEQGISAQAASWFDDTKSRLNIETAPASGSLSGAVAVPGGKP